jgi:cytochrome c553
LGGLLKHVHNETRGAYSALTAQAIRDLSAYVRALTAKHHNDSDSDKEANP